MGSSGSKSATSSSPSLPYKINGEHVDSSGKLQASYSLPLSAYKRQPNSIDISSAVSSVVKPSSGTSEWISIKGTKWNANESTVTYNISLDPESYSDLVKYGRIGYLAINVSSSDIIIEFILDPTKQPDPTGKRNLKLTRSFVSALHRVLLREISGGKRRSRKTAKSKRK